MDETLIKAILESSKNDQTIMKALSRILDDLEEVKAGLSKLTGKPYDV
jgi:hypothetical protein